MNIDDVKRISFISTVVVSAITVVVCALWHLIVWTNNSDIAKQNTYCPGGKMLSTVVSSPDDHKNHVVCQSSNGDIYVSSDR